ncbi:MAG TPA: hypothetical protein DCP86_00680 [Porphyromonadaceae bacterium]|nr:hypothetical protein [Porphyromonadaceae bacterium]
MKKSFLLSGALLLSLSAFMANAQQLPNVGFDSWKTTCGSSRSVNEKKEVVRPGVEPAEWNGSNVNQTVFGVNKLEPGLVTKQEEGGNKYLQLRNMYVGALGIGSNAPGFINFGTPWVYATSQIKKCDGGTFGGQSFTYKPDAIKGKYKRADSDAEGKPISNNESSHIIVYLWYGTYQSFIGSTDLKTKEEKENVDRAVLGKTTGPISGKLVASCDKAFSSTANNDWETIVVPLNYEANAGNPAMMNVIISAGDYWNRSKLLDGTTLLVDDVDFVYYSTLTSLKAGSKAIALKDGVYNYTVTGKMPTKKEVVATCKSQFADAAVAVDAANYKVTVTVTNQGGKDVDGATQHVYTLQYTAPVVKQYAGILNVEMGGEDVIANATQEVTISYYNDNTCDFSLPNFMFAGNNIGNIEIPNVKVSEDAAGTKTFTDGEVEAMKLADGGIVAHVVLNGGTITSAGVINMPITVGWMSGYPDDKTELPINVLFSSNKKVEVTEAGYFYVIKGDDYQHPLVEHQTTMLKSVKYGDMNGFTYTLSLDGVNAGGINFGDMAVAGLDNTDEQYSGTDASVALGNGKTASVTVDGGKNATTGKYEVKFATTVDGQLYNIVFTTDDASSSVNDVEASGAAVRGAEGAIVVEGFAGRVNVYTVDGRLAVSAQIDGEATITVAAGLYVVRAGEKAVKVVVK